jgi:hypothetical protein
MNKNSTALSSLLIIDCNNRHDLWRLATLSPIRLWRVGKGENEVGEPLAIRLFMGE